MLNVHLPFDPEIQLSDIHAREMKTHVYTKFKHEYS